MFGLAKAISGEPRSLFANGLGALTVLDGEVSSIRVVLACYRISRIGVSVNSLFRMLFSRNVVPISPGMTAWIFWGSVKGTDKCSALTIHRWFC